MSIENRLYVELWGNNALFTRPEMKVERYSYDIITPSAARNILEAIYWHPGCEYIIDRIYLLSKYNASGVYNCKKDPIKMISVKRNEVTGKGSAENVVSMMKNGVEAHICADKTISQRNSVILKDVHYVIEAHIEVTDEANETDNMTKFLEIFTRRCDNGQCFYQPYFGCKEFSCNFALWHNPFSVPCVDLDRDFGLMLYDMHYPKPNSDGGRSPAEPMFYRAVMHHGVVQVSGSEVYR